MIEPRHTRKLLESINTRYGGSNDSRLEYADRLDEAGQSLRAEYIRISCQLAAKGLAGDIPGWYRLLGLQHDILMSNFDRELYLVPDGFGVNVRNGSHVELYDEKLEEIIHLQFCRGFLSRIRCRVNRFLYRDCRECEIVPGSAGLVRLFNSHPIVSVALTGCEPSEWSAGAEGDKREWIWERSMRDQPGPDVVFYLGAGPHNTHGRDEDAAIIPGAVFDTMEGEAGGFYLKMNKYSCRRYGEQISAFVDLDMSATNLGRSFAGLEPVLPEEWEERD